MRVRGCESRKNKVKSITIFIFTHWSEINERQLGTREMVGMRKE